MRSRGLGARFLEVAEFGEGLVELAGEALAVEAQVSEGSTEFIEGGEPGILVVEGTVVGVLVEEIGFDGCDAKETPAEVGQELDEDGFGLGLRVVLIVEGCDVSFVDFGVLAWNERVLAGEAVAESVEGRSVFAFLGFRSGGELGVGAIDFGASLLLRRGYHRFVDIARR
jgi:hypothetical protein